MCLLELEDLQEIAQCLHSLLLNDLLLATKHIIYIVAEVVMAYIAILESFHEVAN